MAVGSGWGLRKTMEFLSFRRLGGALADGMWPIPWNSDLWLKRKQDIKIYIYIHIYTCIYIYTNVYIYVFLYIDIHRYIHIYVFVCCICAHTNVQYLCAYARIHTHIICLYIHSIL